VSQSKFLAIRLTMHEPLGSLWGRGFRMARPDINLEDLALRMCALDERAYGEFAEHFGPRFRAAFVKRGLPFADAEELAVSCVLDIALKVSTYRPVNGRGFEAWVFTLAHRSLRNWWWARESAGSDSEDLLPHLSAEDEVENDAGLIFAVHEALAQLSEAGRAIIQAVNFCEQTVAEVGATIGLSERAAQVRHQPALKRLRAILARDERIIRHPDR
jgi:RNA polymerase sigma factor (sigma-70 family)